jgi:ElaB/YqjD/DUF883 family membrane-anchored ribosome-binding protein
MVAPAEGTDKSPTGSKRATVAELEAQLEILRAEVEKLSAQLESSSEISLRAMRKAAAAGMDQIKAQGEAAMDGLRSNAHDLEDQLYATVREKPATSLAIAAGVGFLFALLARR